MAEDTEGSGVQVGGLIGAAQKQMEKAEKTKREAEGPPTAWYNQPQNLKITATPEGDRRSGWGRPLKRKP